MNETQKAGTLLGETFLNAIRVAVREEIRATLKEGGFSIDDRLMDADEASKLLAVSKDWLYRHAGKLPFTRRLGATALRFSYRGIQEWIANRKTV